MKNATALQWMVAVLLLGISLSGCSPRLDTTNWFSRVDEVLVFKAVTPERFELVNRTGELTGKPMDIHFLPDGDALIAMHPGGLVRFDPESGEMGYDFGPGSAYDIEFLDGREINGIAAQYLTSDYFDEHLTLLDAEGIEVGRIPAPMGVHDVDLLENGNLLRVDARENVVREVTTTGEVVWTSEVPLLNPYEVHVTARGTYLISNYDRHSMTEIDRENRIVSDTRGFDHPRRLQEIASDQYILADSDKRRVVALMPDRQVVPLVEGLNRTLSVAWDAERSLLLVGVEDFFKNDPNEEKVEPNVMAKVTTGAIWFFISLIPIVLLFLFQYFRETIYRNVPIGVATFHRTVDLASPVLLPLAILLAISSALCFASYLYFGGWILFGFAALFALLCAYRRDQWFPLWPTMLEEENDEEDEPPKGIVQRPWMLLSGALLCWFTFLWSISWPDDTWMVLPWIVGPWLCVYGFRRNANIPFDPVNAIWVLVILLVAVFFRTWNIHELPWGLWIDELYAPMRAMTAYETGPIQPFNTTILVDDIFLMSNMYILINAYALKYISTSFEMVKAFSILPGIGIVIGTYLLAKWSFGSWAGRVAGMFAAFNSWLVCFARWGWLPQWYIMLAVLALAFFIRAWRYRCPRSAAICGVIMGYCFFTYLPVVITTATLVALFAIGLLTNDRMLRVKQLLIALFMGAIVFAPQWNYYLNNPGEFLRRAGSASIMTEVERTGSIQPIIVSATKYALAFHVDGDFNKRHNSPRVLTDPTTGDVIRDPNTGAARLNPRAGNPMLDAITGGLMLLGLLLCMTRFYRPAERMLLLALTTAMVGGIMSLLFEAPNTYRLGPVGPICCVLAALPVALWLRQREATDGENDEEPTPRWPLVVFILLLAFMLPINFYKYFALMPNQYAWPESLNAENHTVYMALSPEDLGTTKLYLHRQFGHDPKFGFYSTLLEAQAKGSYATKLTQNTRYTVIDLMESKPYLSPGVNTIVQPPSHEAILRETYPGAEIEVLQNPYGRTIAVIARVEG